MPKKSTSELSAYLRSFSSSPMNEAADRLDELDAAVRAGNAAATELFAELGNKRAGDWGIINDGMLALGRFAGGAQ